VRLALSAVAAVTLIATVSATRAAAATHYRSGSMGAQSACEYAYRDYVAFNQVVANADAVCEALSNSSSPPNPISGILYTNEDCIGGVSTSAGAHYGATLPALYAWTGNRHSYGVTVDDATHFDIWI
jgi:hypothetical protein